MLPSMINRNWFPTVFDDFFDNNELMPRFSATAPAVNVKENAKEYVMEVAAPGIKKEEDKKSRYLRREFSYSNYQQAYSLPENVDKEHIEAKVDNGVLSITLPKYTHEEESKAQRVIEIK